MTTNADTWLKLSFAVITAVAAALGVQLSPAARPADVADVVRLELAPLKTQVDHIAAEQDDQRKRLTKVEAVVLSADATSTEN